MNAFAEFDSKTLKLLREEVIVELARRHPAYLQLYVFGLAPTVFHMEWYERAIGLRRSVTIAARGHAKSTCLTVCMALWSLGVNPDLRVVIASASAGQSEKFLREIGDIIRYSSAYRRVFGNLFDASAVWTQRQKTVRRPKQQKDASILAIGVGTGFAGARADLLILDDICDQNNTLTTGRRDTVHRWILETAIPALDPVIMDRVVMVGTIWHYDDATVRQAQVWESGKYPAIDGEGVILWEERFSREKLAELRHEMGSYFFDAQYLCEPVGADGALLRVEWLQESEPVREGTIFYGVDTAIVPEEEASSEIDYTGVVKFIANGDGVQIWAVHRFRVTLPTLLDWLALEGEKDGCSVSYIEKAGIGDAAVRMLGEMIDYPMDVEGVSHRSTKKESRMILMSPLFENGTVTISSECIGGDLLRSEWRAFPFSSHDDVLDACEVGLRGHGIEADVGYQTM